MLPNIPPGKPGSGEGVGEVTLPLPLPILVVSQSAGNVKQLGWPSCVCVCMCVCMYVCVHVYSDLTIHPTCYAIINALADTPWNIHLEQAKASTANKPAWPQSHTPNRIYIVFQFLPIDQTHGNSPTAITAVTVAQRAP